MSIQLVKINCTAVPVVIEPDIRAVHAKTGYWPISVYRGPECEPIINPCGEHSQRQLVNASPAQRAQWGVLGTPNPIGRSTHECRSDGVAFSGPVGRIIEDGQCGMDYPNQSIPVVMWAFRVLGHRPFHPYTSGVEYHHIDLLTPPTRVVNFFLPLHVGQAGKSRASSGVFVYILSSRLKTCGYLRKKTSKFDYPVRDAVIKYQHHHHMTMDGIVGEHTWAALKASERWCKKHRRTEV